MTWPLIINYILPVVIFIAVYFTSTARDERKQWDADLTAAERELERKAHFEHQAE